MNIDGTIQRGDSGGISQHRRGEMGVQLKNATGSMGPAARF